VEGLSEWSVSSPLQLAGTTTSSESSSTHFSDVEHNASIGDTSLTYYAAPSVNDFDGILLVSASLNGNISQVKVYHWKIFQNWPGPPGTLRSSPTCLKIFPPDTISVVLTLTSPLMLI
jgi:hypothetical protein